ncbi:MAG: hypothetical protein HQL40_15435 [Alphaproteobacteria bacterium]|nr:hypothetical protein [Alphaproteobacteria bacterium]
MNEGSHPDEFRTIYPFFSTEECPADALSAASEAINALSFLLGGIEDAPGPKLRYGISVMLDALANVVETAGEQTHAMHNRLREMKDARSSRAKPRDHGQQRADGAESDSDLLRMAMEVIAEAKIKAGGPQLTEPLPADASREAPAAAPRRTAASAG